VNAIARDRPECRRSTENNEINLNHGQRVGLGEQTKRTFKKSIYIFDDISTKIRVSLFFARKVFFCFFTANSNADTKGLTFETIDPLVRVYFFERFDGRVMNVIVSTSTTFQKFEIQQIKQSLQPEIKTTYDRTVFIPVVLFNAFRTFAGPR